MHLAEIQGWILVLSGSATMISVAVGVWLSLREYRLKLKAEQRQQQTSEVEAEIRLHTLFTDLMRIANGRSGYQVSEKAVDFLLTNLKSEDGNVDIAALHRTIEHLAVLHLPVGSASQAAAIAAIASLTMKHPVLRESGMCALESLIHPVTTPVAEQYYQQVRAFFDKENG